MLHALNSCVGLEISDRKRRVNFKKLELHMYVIFDIKTDNFFIVNIFTGQAIKTNLILGHFKIYIINKSALEVYRVSAKA